MKKSDLKTGMLVMLHDGDIQLLVNETFICKGGGFNNIDSWDDNLKYLNTKQCYDIIKVSSVLNGYDLGCENWRESLIDSNLLWKKGIEIFACELDGVTYSESTLRSLIKKAHNS